MRIAFGCDHAGFPVKEAILEALQADGHDVLDLGTFSDDPVDYPDFARAVGNAVRNRFVDMGVLVCGSGVGASIAANKIRGIRAALVHDQFTARQSREDDDANVICLGARALEAETAVALTQEFLKTPFSNAERHVRRVAKIVELESGLPTTVERSVRSKAAAESAVVAPAAPRPKTAPAAPLTRPEPPAAPAAAPTRGRATEPAPSPPPPVPASKQSEPVRAPSEAPVEPTPTPPPPTRVEPAPPVPAPERVAARAEGRRSEPASEREGPSRPQTLEEVAREAAATITAEPATATAPAHAPVHTIDDAAIDDVVELDPTTLAPAQAALKQIESMEFGERLWVKDATLWSDVPEAQAAIRNRLGWLTSPTLMREYTADLKTFATEVRRLGFSNVVLLGMGGSSLAPEVMNRTFGSKMGFPDLAVLDTTDPLSVKNTLARLQLSRTLFVVSSKSGTTDEVLALYKFCRSQVDASKPPKSGQHFVAITDPGSSLEKLAKEGGFRRTFLNHPSIGGRFSALSFFGLVPAAMIGIDIDRLLERAGEMVTACGESVPTAENPAFRLAALLAGFAAKGRDKVTLVLPEKIRTFGLWLEQLLAESTGKDGKGLIPVDLEPLGPPTAYGNDRLFVALSLPGDPRDPALHAIGAAGHPVHRIRLRDPYDLGGEFFRWELAVACAGSLLGVNPFDEPNVAQAKEATQAMLAAYKKAKRLPDWPVDCEEDGILLLGSQGTKPPSVTEGLKQFLSGAKPGDYVAILAYFTPDHETTEALQMLRTVIRDRLRVATTVGYGPRYLHSTGQLHKGGPPTVLALQLTGDDKEDVQIPGDGYGFAALKAAQALGDLETLRKADRRVVRLHLGGRAPAAVEKLAGMVKRAIK